MATLLNRFIWWLYHDANAAGVVQAFTAIVITILTGVLIGVTAWYAALTRRMAKTMERQLAAGFQPDIEMFFEENTVTERADDKQPRKSVTGVLILRNLCDSPMKLVDIGISLLSKEGFPVVEAEYLSVKGLILSPRKDKTFKYRCDVPQEVMIDSKTARKAVVNCSDLTGFSKHSFEGASYEGGIKAKEISHYVGFQNIA